MISEQFLKFFSTFKRMKPDVKFLLCGNFEQLLPVCDRVKDADYEGSPVIFELSDGNRINLSKCRRSDDKIYNMCLPENIENIKPSDYGNKLCKTNLCFTNETRKNVNQCLMKRFSKNKHNTKVEKLVYDDNSQDAILYKGLPIISRKTTNIQTDDDKVHICKNEIFKIKRLSNDKSTIDIISPDNENIEISIPVNLFNIFFKVAYAITIHSSQGLTIKDDITIHEFSKFDNRLKYVAISRCQKVSQLNFL